MEVESDDEDHKESDDEVLFIAEEQWHYKSLNPRMKMEKLSWRSNLMMKPRRDQMMKIYLLRKDNDIKNPYTIRFLTHEHAKLYAH